MSSLFLSSRSLSSPVLSSRLFLFASALGSSSSIRPLLTLFLPSVTNCCCIIGVFPVVVLTYPHRAQYNLGSLPAREPEKRLPHLRKALSKSPRVSCGLRPTRFPSFPSSTAVFFCVTNATTTVTSLRHSHPTLSALSPFSAITLANSPSLCSSS